MAHKDGILMENEVEMKRLIAEKEVTNVRLEVADISGCSRGLHLNANYFLKNYEGGFAEPQMMLGMTPPGDLVPHTGILDEISYRNGGLFPDLATFQVLPWVDKTASVLVDFRTDSSADSPYHPCSTRVICKKQLDKLQSLGYQLYSAFEYEFYMLNQETGERINEDVNFLSTQNAGQHSAIINEVMGNMESIGIEPEHFHCEYGPGQLELTHSPAFGIKGSDNAFRYKQLAKDVFSNHGYLATFLTKPFPDFSGSSGHYNHSLWDVDGKSVFHDPAEKYGISKIAQHWLAGLRYHADTLLCFTSPTPNCFERTKAGGFAPQNDAWGLDNRSVAYRVKNNSTKNIYFENRLAASGANPYLVTAVCIIAGMDGIKRQLPLMGDPYEGEISTASVLPDDVRALPNSLSKSIECLLKNEVFVEELGPEFMKLFTATKMYEHDKAEQVKLEKGDLFKWYMDYYGTYI